MSALFAVVASISGVAAKAGIVSYGLSTGVGQSRFNSDSYGDIYSELGFQVAGSLRVALSPSFSVTPELVSSNNHFNFDNPDIKIVNHSLSIPIVGGFTLLPFLTAEAGPRFTFIDKSVVTPSDGAKLKRNGDLYETVGYLVGLRVKLGKISVGGRFNGQFRKHDSDTFGSVGTHSYSVSVGFRL